MKNKNKLIITILAIFVSLVGIINAHAANFSLGTTHGTTDPNSLIITENKTLTVSNVPTGDVLTAYKIIDTYYNASSNAISYEFTNDFKAFLASTNDYSTLTVEDYSNLTSGNLTSGVVTSTSSLDTLVSKYVTYIKDHNITGTDMTTSGTSRTASLAIGSYLVIPKTTSKIYAVMVGNLEVTEDNGEWTSNNQNIVAKVSEPGLITKTIAGNKETDSAYIGTEFTYSITGTVPTYPTNATNKTYTITDTMSNGLTFSGITSMSFMDGTTRLTVNANGSVTDSSNHTVATVTVSGQVITIAFNLDYIKGTEITITYKATLNALATVGGSGNKNQAVLTYANDPYSDSTYTSEPSETLMYTYGIEILKYSGTNKNEVLGNATFDIYSNASLTTKVGTITTDTNGIAEYTGVPAGTYYLKETKAPSGHSLLGDIVTIEVAGTNSTTSPNHAGYYYVEISNNKNLLLPFTGGIGTYAYTIIGLSIIVIAVIIFIIYRKRKDKKENDEK